MQTCIRGMRDRPVPVAGKDVTGEMRTKEQLLEDLAKACRRIAELERSSSDLRKTSEAASQESDHRFRAMFERHQAVMLLIEPDSGAIVDANPAAAEFYGYPRAGLISMNIADINTLPPEVIAAKRNQARLEKHNYFVFPHRLAGGEIRTVEVHSTPIEEKGQLLLFSIVHDITERKRMEEVIQKTAHDWQSTFDSVQDLVMVLDHEFRIDRVNAATVSFFDLPAERIMNNPCYTLMHCTTEPHEECPLAKMMLTKRHEEAELFDERRKAWFLVSVDPIFDDLGAITRVVHTVKDITGRKRAEDEKARLEARLVQAEKIEALGKLAGGIAHDFNNVLQPILINAELVSEMLSPGTQEHEYLDQLIEAAQLGKSMVRQIKLFGFRTDSRCNPITLDSTAREALNFFKRSLPSHITFRYWMPAKKSLVRADPTQIYQLILNLCMNAVQAMAPPRGFLGVSLKDTVITEAVPAFVSDLKPGKYVKLVVRDTGRGISPDIRGKIFDPFFTTRKTSKGTGLGLSVVHEVVKSTGGSILIHSEENRGTRFEVFFPLCTDSADEPHLPGPQTAGQGRRHILLVDDNSSDLDSIQKLLVHLGYKVTSSADPNEALRIFRDKPEQFALLITDQVMPRMRGHELASRVREIRGDIPVIVCTGWEGAAGELKEHALPVQELILKPFSKSILADAIRRALS